MAQLGLRNRPEADRTVELLHDKLSYHQAKSYSTPVTGSSRFREEAEELEHLVLLFVGNSDPSVRNFDLEVLPRVPLVHDFDRDAYRPASLGELESVHLEAEQDLHDALGVALDVGGNFVGPKTLILRLGVGLDVEEFDLEINFLLLGLQSLNVHDLLDSFDNVDFGCVLLELPGLELAVVEEVGDREVHQVGRCLHHFVPGS